MSRRSPRIGRSSTDEDLGVRVVHRPTMLRGLVGEILHAGDCELGRNVGLSKFSDDSVVVVPRRITTHAGRATWSRLEADLIRLRTREGMRGAKVKGKLRGKQPKLNP